jgi:phosphate transport system permease protein
MTARPHPFRRQANASALQEVLVFWMLRSFTYLILAFGLLIFSIIIYKGAPAVFGSFRVDGSVPFIHNDFLFTKPQTLHVFKYKGEVRQMSADQFYAFQGQPVATSVRPGLVAASPASPKAASTPETPASAPAAPTSVLSSTGVDPNDITEHQTFSYAAGGIWPQIVGTVLLVIGSMTIALILGIFSAIYLSEYSRDGPIIHAIRLAIINLAGVPSIVFGLFGVGLFVLYFKWNVSLMAGWFTLAFMVLPVIITASEESLRAVPKGFREGSLALGATKWQTIWSNVLPYALPGILTSSVLGIARVAGETAPILFTAAYATSDKLPWDMDTTAASLHPGLVGYLEYPFAWLHHIAFSGVNALPYHIYVVSSKIPQNAYTERVQYGTAFVFLVVVMVIALASVLLRLRLRSRLKW